MAEYAITFARSAREELENLSINVAVRALGKIEALAANPRLPGTIKLHGHRNLRRMRAGDYWVIYSINDLSKMVDISIVRHRRDVYRDL
ncbi:MAG TPA: type II toxin-antitoxin system RelE/ParE family toxin [Verrucomicrobiae bacterium]|jgi:mRNA interferase RelE/StbE